MVRRFAWCDWATFPQCFEEKPECGSTIVVGTLHRSGTSTLRQVLLKESVDCCLADLPHREASVRHPVREVRDTAKVDVACQPCVSAFFKECLIARHVLGQHTLVQPRQWLRMRDYPIFHDNPLGIKNITGERGVTYYYVQC